MGGNVAQQTPTVCPWLQHVQYIYSTYLPAVPGYMHPH